MNDDDVTPARTAQRGPWWLITRNLVTTVIFELVWALLFVVRLVAVLTKSSVSTSDVVLVVISGLLAVAIIPSVVYHLRRRRG